MIETGVLGLFAEPSQAAAAIRSLRAAGLDDVRVAMPAPFPEVMDAVGKPRSGVGVGVFMGCVLGLIGGLGLCAATSLAWPLVVGGKPILAWPTFLVIGFECAVLIGGSVTHLMLAYTTATGRARNRMPVADLRFATDRIGVFVLTQAPGAAQLLTDQGAEEVRRVG